MPPRWRIESATSRAQPPVPASSAKLPARTEPACLLEVRALQHVMEPRVLAQRVVDGIYLHVPQPVVVLGAGLIEERIAALPRAEGYQDETALRRRGVTVCRAFLEARENAGRLVAVPREGVGDTAVHLDEAREALVEFRVGLVVSSLHRVHETQLTMREGETRVHV